MIPANITITIQCPELTKAIDALSLSLIAVSQKMTKPAKGGGRAARAARAETPAATIAPKIAPPNAKEVVEPTHDEEAVTTKAKELVAAASPAVLRGVLDTTIGKGVKISGAPKDTYDAIYTAVDAKLTEINSV